MVYDDIAEFADEEIRMIWAETERQDWVLGLKGGSEALISRIFQIVGDEESMKIKADMKASGPSKMSKVEYVQLGIVYKVLQLEQDGKLKIPREHDPWV